MDTKNTDVTILHYVLNMYVNFTCMITTSLQQSLQIMYTCICVELCYNEKGLCVHTVHTF